MKSRLWIAAIFLILTAASARAAKPDNFLYSVTAPYAGCFVDVTIVDDRSKTSRFECIPAQSLAAAIGLEQDASRDWPDDKSIFDVILTNKARLYHFKSTAALAEVAAAYTTGQGAAARRRLDRLGDRQIASIVDGPSAFKTLLGPGRHSAGEVYAMAEAVTARGYVVARQSGETGPIVVLTPDHVDKDYARALHFYQDMANRYRLASRLIRQQTGFSALYKDFTLGDRNAGYGGFVVDLRPRNPGAIVDDIRYQGKTVDGKPQQTWTAFLDTASRIEAAARRQSWLVHARRDGFVTDVSADVNGADVYTVELTNDGGDIWGVLSYPGEPDYKLTLTTAVDSIGLVLIFDAKHAALHDENTDQEVIPPAEQQALGIRVTPVDNYPDLWIIHPTSPGGK